MEIKEPLRAERNISTYLKTKIFLASGGIFTLSPENRTYEILYSVAYTIVTLFHLTGIIIGTINIAEFQDKMESVTHIVACLLSLSLHWGIKYHRRSLFKFLDQLQKLNTSHDKVVWRSENLFSKIASVITTTFYMFYVIFIASSFLKVLSDGNLNSKTAYVVPAWYECATTFNDTSWYWQNSLCWNIDNYFKYVIVNSTASFLETFVLIPHLTTFLFYAYVIFFLHANVEVMKQKIQTLFEILTAQAVRKDDAAFITDKYGQIVKQFAKRRQNRDTYNSLGEIMKNYQIMYR